MVGQRAQDAVYVSPMYEHGITVYCGGLSNPGCDSHAQSENVASQVEYIAFHVPGVPAAVQTYQQVPAHGGIVDVVLLVVLLVVVGDSVVVVPRHGVSVISHESLPSIAGRAQAQPVGQAWLILDHDPDVLFGPGVHRYRHRTLVHGPAVVVVGTSVLVVVQCAHGSAGVIVGDGPRTPHGVISVAHATPGTVGGSQTHSPQVVHEAALMPISHMHL